MRRIYGIGESLLDIIFRNGQPQTAKAGGSMLNSVVSLGRIALPVSFISEYGMDEVGNLIDNFLKDNGVDTRFVHRCKDGKTVVALAFLDDKNDASYSFYKNYPEKRLDIAFPQINKGDIILCGSFYSIAAEIREKFKNFIMGAKEKNAFVIYDPNFRKSHLNELEKLKSLIIENIQMATLLRGSDEDFKNIFGTANPDEAWDAVKKHSKCLVYTANVEGVYVRTTSFSGKFPVKKIKPVSTIGAGDNFNAGMITAFYQNNIYPDQLETLTIKDWERVISTAVKFATHVCRSYENYISFEFANKYFSASKLQM
jgi:fructokinase